MIFLLLGSTPYQLFSQTVNCPDYSFCLEVDPVNCDEISVSINGLSGTPIIGLRFTIDVSQINIDIQATEQSFLNTAIGQFFNGQGPNFLNVSQNLIEIQYPGISGPFVTNEDCIHIGNIVFENIEIDCLPDGAISSIDIIPLSPGPLLIGQNLANYTTCPIYTFDCPCSGGCPIDDWIFCFSKDGCGKINVFLIDLELVEYTGIRFNFTFDPNLQIDEQLTKNSIQSNPFLGGHNWEISDLHITSNTISFFYANETVVGNNKIIFDNVILLFDIYFIPMPGECLDFGENGMSFGNQSGLFIGENLTDPDIEFCENYSSLCPSQVCTDGVTLSGNILRPTNAGSCDEAIDFGFPFGLVTVTGSYCGYPYEFEVLTEENGYYELPVFPNNDYIVLPSYTEEHKYACGVNSTDAEIIRSVLLTGSCFQYPFSNLAADMNLNGTVTTYDIALVQRYILETEYPIAGKWRFLPSTQYQNLFDGVSCPGTSVPSYSTFINANVLAVDYTAGNFRAIKMGDVDGSCEQCLETGSLQNTPKGLMVSARYNENDKSISLFSKDQLLPNITVVNIRIDGGKGIQFKHHDVEEKLYTDEIIIKATENNVSTFGWTSLQSHGKDLQPLQDIVTFDLEDFSYPFGLQLILAELISDGQLYQLVWDESIEIVDKAIQKKSMAEIFPNPGLDQFQIKLSQPISTPYNIEILDLLGNNFGSYQMNNPEMQLSTKHLMPGSYNIIITGPNFFERHLWIKFN